MVPPADDHDCGWKAYAEHQERRAAQLEDRLTALEKAFKRKSERREKSKLPPAVAKKPATSEEKKQTRRAMAELRDTKLETVIEQLPVPPSACACDACGNTELREVGKGKPSTIYEYIPPSFQKVVLMRQTLACKCGRLITAEAPARVGEKTRYAPSFVAHLCTSKLADSIPQHRLEKEYKRLGIPIARSTMNALLHRAATELKPLHDAACAMVKKGRVVGADETSVRQANLDKKAFMWTFNTPELSVYKYAETRSGKVAVEMLGESEGVIVVDQYTGYNQVTKPGMRVRAGCMAHTRRKIFESTAHAGFDEALELIGKLYEVEREAKEAGLEGTAEHLAMRTERSRPLFAQLLSWGRKQRGRHEPRSGAGRAVNYLMKNRAALRVFLIDAEVPIDNNASERDMRPVAMGRSNYLFFQHKESGERHATLYTLVKSAEKNGLNPTAYLADVLVRVHTHPQSRIEELLPHRWKPPDG